jgi:hypothetical protein
MKPGKFKIKKLGNLRYIDGFFLSCRDFYFLPSNFEPSEHLDKVKNCLKKNKSYDMIERIHRCVMNVSLWVIPDVKSSTTNKHTKFGFANL